MSAPAAATTAPRAQSSGEKCGISLGFSRPAILDGNRWSPAPDELAAFFRFKAMQGFFTKTLHVPPGMKAWVLQGDNSESQTLQLPEGEYTTETLFQRLNNFFRSAHGEVLVCRTDALPVDLKFSGILSAELLPLDAALTLHIRVADVHAFRRRFMLQDGVATTANLVSILGGAVRQALAEVVGARHVDEMLADSGFRDRLVVDLRSKLDPLLADLGLQAMHVSELTLHHDALDEHNALRGRLWLVRKEAQIRAEHDRALEEIDDEGQWAVSEIASANYAGGRPKAGWARKRRTWPIPCACATWISTSASWPPTRVSRPLAWALRTRSPSLKRNTQQDAASVKRGPWGERFIAENEVDNWKHLQELARIKHDGEVQLARLHRDAATALERQRIQNAISRAAAPGRA